MHSPGTLSDGRICILPALCYKYFSEPSRLERRTRRPARTRSALYSFFHARSRAAARANDKLCTRICIFDTWLQRPGRNVPALSYVTGPAALSAFGFVVSLSLSSRSPAFYTFRASFCNCGIPLFIHDINFAFYYIALYYVKFVYYSKILFVKRKKKNKLIPSDDFLRVYSRRKVLENIPRVYCPYYILCVYRTQLYAYAQRLAPPGIINRPIFISNNW